MIFKIIISIIYKPILMAKNRTLSLFVIHKHPKSDTLVYPLFPSEFMIKKHFLH